MLWSVTHSCASLCVLEWSKAGGSAGAVPLISHMWYKHPCTHGVNTRALSVSPGLKETWPLNPSNSFIWFSRRSSQHFYQWRKWQRACPRGAFWGRLKVMPCFLLTFWYEKLPCGWVTTALKINDRWVIFSAQFEFPRFFLVFTSLMFLWSFPELQPALSTCSSPAEQTQGEEMRVLESQNKRVRRACQSQRG